MAATKKREIATLRFIYLAALKIETAAFWSGWKARKNYRWGAIAGALCKMAEALKRIYFRFGR
jgi:hypothetical protein